MSSITRQQFQAAIKVGLNASMLPTAERVALWQVANKAAAFDHEFIPEAHQPGCPAVQAGIYWPGRFSHDEEFNAFVTGFDNYVRDTLKVSDVFDGSIKVTD